MIMRRGASDIPPLVIFMALACAAMLLPAAHALALRELPVARAFFYSALILGMLTAMIAVATAGSRMRLPAQVPVLAVVGAYLVVPLFGAVPLQQSVPGLPFVAAWFEMLSAFTTTGASVFEASDQVPLPVHFWRALMGWGGGFFILVMIAAVLAPLGHVASGLIAADRTVSDASARYWQCVTDPSRRMYRYAGLFFVPYAGMTAVIWVGLLLCGDSAFVALCHAMGTLSTSGISPLAVGVPSPSGMAGEVLIFAGLCFAVTRQFWPRGLHSEKARFFWHDPELQLAALVLGGVTVVVTFFVTVKIWAGPFSWAAAEMAKAAWGGVFTGLSFMTTTGFVSASWPDAGAPGVILIGLAMMGGGVATAAGGVKLLRIYALLRHAERELERIVHPHSIGGHGPIARRMRREGAYLAWMFFMIFGLLIAGVTLALTLTGLRFEPALILAIASITTTGQLAYVAGDLPIGYVSLGSASHAILGAGMVLGRLEILAIFAVLAPEGWRR